MSMNMADPLVCVIFNHNSGVIYQEHSTSHLYILNNIKFQINLFSIENCTNEINLKFMFNIQNKILIDF